MLRIKTQSISVLLNITKFADFEWKNADVSRSQRVRHVIVAGFYMIAINSFYNELNAAINK